MPPFEILKVRVGDMFVERVANHWRVYAVGNVVEFASFEAAVSFAQAAVDGREAFASDEAPTWRKPP